MLVKYCDISEEIRYELNNNKSFNYHSIIYNKDQELWISATDDKVNGIIILDINESTHYINKLKTFFRFKNIYCTKIVSNIRYISFNNAISTIKDLKQLIIQKVIDDQMLSFSVPKDYKKIKMIKDEIENSGGEFIEDKEFIRFLILDNPMIRSKIENVD